MSLITNNQRIWKQWLYVSIVVWLIAGAATEEEAIVAGADDNDDTLTALKHPLVEWLISKKGGYVSDKLKFDNFGVFATQDIVKDELIMFVPPNAYIMPRDVDIREGDEEEECGTARRIVYEYTTLGESQSEYWPYVQYVFETFPHTTIPMAWSHEGQQLYRDICGNFLCPEWIGEDSYAESCKNEDDDDIELLEIALRIVVARSWIESLVPVYDMVNHRNGKYYNVDRDPRNGADLSIDGDFRIIALKDITAGSQLHMSYNQCLDSTCPDIDKTYVTQHIFAQYGFVEQFPQRFAFHTGHDTDELYGMVFELDVPDDNSSTDTYVVRWLSEGSPNHGQLAWMQDQYHRLTNVSSMQEITKRAQQLPIESERNAILEYHQALVTALWQAQVSAGHILFPKLKSTIIPPIPNGHLD